MVRSYCTDGSMDYLKVQISWGATWGETGSFLLQRQSWFWSADFSLVYPLIRWQAEQSLDFSGCSVGDMREMSARQLRKVRILPSLSERKSDAYASFFAFFR